MSVKRAIKEVVKFGYQVEPDALKLLQEALENSRLGGDGNSPESVVKVLMEEKAKAGTGKSISVNDLKSALPEVFDFRDLEPKASLSGSDAVVVSEGIEIVEDASHEVEPTGVEGFPQLFKSRYEKLVRILMERPEGRRLTKISKMAGEKGSVRIAGLVFSKRPTKSGGVEFSIDDDSGSASVLALGADVKKAVGEVALDQCVMVEGDIVQGRLIAKNVVQPDVPSKSGSTSKKTAYAVFLSDLHIGSNKFLDGAFSRFLGWLGGNGVSPEDEEIIRRLKYIVIGGDVVDGVGVFPNQEYELSELNVFKQYELVSSRLSLVPKHLQKLVIPGNHDATRQALPQPMIPEKYAKSLYGLSNVKMLGDPCLFKLHGVSILAYHGRSLDDVLATTPGLSYEKPQEAMKVLLRARHLAPIFGMRTPIAPEVEDHLVINEVPDIFHCGHVHTIGEERYKSTLMINSGTWQGQTGYQTNLGISPTPGVVPIVNLATLDVVWKEFLTSSPTSLTVAG